MAGHFQPLHEPSPWLPFVQAVARRVRANVVPVQTSDALLSQLPNVTVLAVQTQSAWVDDLVPLTVRVLSSVVTSAGHCQLLHEPSPFCPSVQAAAAVWFTSSVSQVPDAAGAHAACVTVLAVHWQSAWVEGFVPLTVRVW